MAAFIFFIIFILGLVLIPYRKVYNRLNQLIDAKTQEGRVVRRGAKTSLYYVVTKMRFY